MEQFRNMYDTVHHPTANQQQGSPAAFAALSDAELISLTRDGNTHAYGALWERYQPTAIHTAAVLLPYDEVQDVVSDAYAKILDALSRGLGPDFAFRPYLVQTVRNTAIKWHQKSEQGDSLDADATLAEHPQSMDYENRHLLLSAFAQLPKRWQDVLWCTEVDGKDTRQAAKELGITPGNAAVLAFRARARLRELWFAAHLDPNQFAGECKPIAELLPGYLGGKITERRREIVEAHLHECAQCTRRIDEAQLHARKLNTVLPLAGAVAVSLSMLGKAPSAMAQLLPTLRATFTVAKGHALAIVITLGIVGAAGGGIASAQGEPIPAPQPSVSASPPLTGEATPPADDRAGTPQPSPATPSRAAAKQPAPAQQPVPATPAAESSASAAHPPAPVETPQQQTDPAPAAGSTGYLPYPQLSATADTAGGLLLPLVSGVAVPGARITVTLGGVNRVGFADQDGQFSVQVVAGGVVGENLLTIREDTSQLPERTLAGIDPGRVRQVSLTVTLQAPSATMDAVAESAGTRYEIRATFQPGSSALIEGVSTDLEQLVGDESGRETVSVRLAPAAATQPFRATIRYVAPDGSRAGVSVPVG